MERGNAVAVTREKYLYYKKKLDTLEQIMRRLQPTNHFVQSDISNILEIFVRKKHLLLLLSSRGVTDTGSVQRIRIMTLDATTMFLVIATKLNRRKRHNMSLYNECHR